MSMPDPAFYTILGWSLGLLSTVGLYYFKRKQELEDFKRGLQVELIDIKIRLTCQTYSILVEFGKLDRDLISWVSSNLRDHVNQLPDKTILTGLEKLLKSDDKQIEGMNRLSPEEMGWHNKKIHLPFLESNISKLALLKRDLQPLVIKISVRIGHLNELIEKYNYYHDKTFDPGLSGRNPEIVKENIKIFLREIAETSRQIVDTISKAKM